MMPGDVWQVKLLTQLDAQTGEMVLHYRVNTIAGTGATDQQVADAFDTLFRPDVVGVISNNALFLGVIAQHIFPLPVRVGAPSVGGHAAGTGGANALPKQTSGLITKYTALAGRKSRGRAYVPFPAPAANQADGSPTAGYISLLGSLAADMQATQTVGAGGNTGVMIPVIYHRSTHTFTDITRCHPSSLWATQRRRGDFGRENTPPL